MIEFLNLRKYSIRNKIIAIILMISAAVISAGFFLVATWDVKQLKADMLSRLTLDAKLIGDYCVVPLTFEDADQAKAALSRLKFIESIEAGYLFDATGRLFAGYPDTARAEPMPAAGAGRNAVIRKGRIFVRETVRYRGRDLGEIWIVAGTGPLEQRKRRIALILTVLMAALVLLTYGMAERMQRVISDPIIRLKRSFDQIAAGRDFSMRVEKPCDDETGDLYDGFNALLDTIDLRNAERTKLIDELNGSRAMLNAVLDTIPQWISWKDERGVYEGCNQAFAHRIGVPHPNAVAGMTDADIPFDPGMKRLREEGPALIRGGTPRSHVVLAHTGPDGERTWTETSQVPIARPGREAKGLLEISEDITERMTAEENLRTSETRYRFLFEQNPVPMLIYETESLLIRAVNDAFSSHYGYGKDEASSMSLTDLYPDDEKGPITELARSLRGHAYAGEWHHIRRDGTVMTIEARSHGFLYEGRPARIAVINDLTDRKNAEDELRWSRQRYKQLLESITDYTYSVEIRDGRPGKTVHGVGCVKVTGFTPEEYETDSRLWIRMVHPDDRWVVEHYADPLAAGKEVPPLEHRILHKNGAVIWVRNAYVLKHDAAGRVVGYDGLIADITERKLAELEILRLNTELEERVRQRTAQLEAANRELEAFSYSVSHDLRAPLRHASGFVDLLLKRFRQDLSEKAVHYLDSVADSVRQMGLLIDDLLQFSRTGRAEMRQSLTDMNRLVEEVRISLQRDASGRDIEWIGGDLPSVVCDEAMLKLVWMNLLGNAVKFTRTRERARIEIGASQEADEWVFSVRDNGVGFDMRYAQKLFGVFQRLHSIDEFEGTGIGLANVRRIVSRHGGRTWAEAEPDRGAAFMFSLPKQQKETA
jgi:PAS domain S-box-containing protein